jgi:hypothetical protein
MFVLDKYPINPSERFLKPLKTSLKRKTPIGETQVKNSNEGNSKPKT